MESETGLVFYSDTYKLYAQIASLSAAGMFVLLGLMGKFHVTFNIIDTIGMVYFLFFIDAEYPNNIIDLSKLFGSYHYSSLPNFIEWVTTLSTDLSTNSRFSAAKFKQSFLSNASLTLSLTASVLAFFLLLELLACIPLRCFRFQLKRSLQQAWEYDCLIDLTMLFSLQLSIYAFLAIGHYSFDSLTDIIDFSLLCLISLIIFVSPFVFGYIVYDRRFDLTLPTGQLHHPIKFKSLLFSMKIVHEEPPVIIRKHSVEQQKILKMLESPNELLETARDNYSPFEQKSFTIIGKYMNAILFLRKPIFAAIVVKLYGYLWVQMGILCAINLTYLFIFAICRPYVRKLDNIRCILVECCFITMQVLLVLVDSSSEQLGWIYIYVCLGAILLNYVSLMFKGCVAIYELFTKKDRQENQNKIAPVVFEPNKPVKKTALSESDLAPKLKILSIGFMKRDAPPVVKQTVAPPPISVPAAPKAPIYRETPRESKLHIPQSELTFATANQVLSSQGDMNTMDSEKTFDHRDRSQLELIGTKSPVVSRAMLKYFNSPNEDESGQVSETRSPFNLRIATTQSLTPSPLFARPKQFEDMASKRGRMRKELFKRNPFITSEDEKLIQMEKSINSRMTTSE